MALLDLSWMLCHCGSMEDVDTELPKKQSLKRRTKRKVKGMVKSKSIEYAKSHPVEVVKSYARAENPKRELALKAMGVKVSRTEIRHATNKCHLSI